VSAASSVASEEDAVPDSATLGSSLSVDGTNSDNYDSDASYDKCVHVPAAASSASASALVSVRSARM
jgi:hypothetical protein